MDLGWDFVVFVTALSIAAFLPGPGLAAIVASVLAQGARKTVWFCVGVVIGDLVWLSLSLGGLAVVAAKIPLLFTAIKWAGVVYLARLAWIAWHASPELEARNATGSETNALSQALAGFSVTMGNPKAMLFYISLLPNLISAETLTAARIIPFYVAVVLVLSLVFAVYVFAAETARSAMKRFGAVRTVNRATASVLGGAALWVASR